MALKQFYDNQDDIPEGLTDYYVEVNNRWELDAEPGEGVKSAEDVRRALQARDNEKAERTRVKAELDKLREVLGDIDAERLPDAIEALKKVEELEHDQLISEKKYEEAAAKKFERRMAELQRNVEAAQNQNAQMEAKIQEQRERLQAVVIEGELQRQFLSEGGDPQKVRYLMMDAKQKWELDPESDEPVPVDFLDNGKTKVTAVGADGKTLTMQEQVKTMLAENPWAVLESSGSRSSHQSGASVNGQYRITETEAKDFGKYKSMKAQAEKANTELEIVPG